MRSQTKWRLVAAVVAVLLIVLAVWYLRTRQAYYQNATLVGLRYRPATGPPPYLTLEFSRPLDPRRAAGPAVLKSFALDVGAPEGAAALVRLLTEGPTVGGRAQGPVPFVAAYDPAAPNLLTTNTLPGQIAALAAPLDVTGTGVVWFAAPPAK